MKEAFTQKKFTAEARAMIDLINGILDDYEAAGYDLSLRQLYYQLVSRNLVVNTERSYKNVGNLVSEARLAGLIDWNMIKDRGREMVCNPHWSDPAEFLRSAAPQFKMNLWEGQENYVEVMVEKQALEGVLEPVCRMWDVPFTANKGYSSSSAMYEASKRFIAAANEDRSVFVIYLGDHDPSGIDMSRDVQDRLNLFINVTMGFGSNEGDLLTVVRVALNMDQVRELNPPENPAKITDSRANDYIRRFGRSSWELDAIEPKRLAALVESAIKSKLDLQKFNACKKTMMKGRSTLEKFADGYKE